ncbi:MAG TPA: thioredoxin family protein [Thermoanaerobaculia bacterium]|nr:thioredoxin family protein [Thermoanaerobaculia bacterium]
MTTTTKILSPAFALTAMLALVGAVPLAAQNLSGFTPSEDYMVEIDGQPAPTAHVYWSQSARAFLIVAKELPAPLLVEPVSRQVRSVPLVKLASRSDGSVGILEGAALTPKAVIDTSQGPASFSVDGRMIKLVEKPALVGWQTLDSLGSYSAKYAERAAAYEPKAGVVNDLRARGEDVRLTVFFGSWCPFCQQKVPLAMKLARELVGSNVKIDFYGLPRLFSGDAQAKRYGIKSVPTGVVFVGGKEVGRISADGWASPETTLDQIVSR